MNIYIYIYIRNVLSQALATHLAEEASAMNKILDSLRPAAAEKRRAPSRSRSRSHGKKKE